MKKRNINKGLLLLFSITLFVLNTAIAQLSESPKSLGIQQSYNNMEFGIKIMPSFASFTMKTFNGQSMEGDATHGYGYGISVGKNFSKNIGSEIDFIYNSFSKTYQDNNLKRTVTINYVNIPLLFCLSTDKSLPVNFNIVCGPQVGFNAGSKTKLSVGSANDSLLGVLSMKQIDIDIAYGAGLDFSFSKSKYIHAGIGFRGAYGLTNIGNADNKPDANTYYLLDRTNIKTYSGYVSLTFGF